jgi:uncharacterized membrane protein
MSDPHHPPELQPHHSSELEKEFELERMILFSDAVFAIAITLMVIDVKWPEIPESLNGVNLYTLFRPTIFQFIVFALSFFYIGRSWSQHLKLFRLLRTYDQGLINRNLLFLFFIVTFPFTASGIFGHIRNGFILPMFLYTFNLSAVTVTHFLICRYIFHEKPGLSIRGEEMEKKYIYIRGKYTAIGMSSIFVLSVLVGIIFRGNPDYIGYVYLLIPVVISRINREAKKYKPKTIAS